MKYNEIFSYVSIRKNKNLLYQNVELSTPFYQSYYKYMSAITLYNLNIKIRL